MHYFPQQWDIATKGQSQQHGPLNTAGPPTQYTALLSVSPAVQQHPPASTVSTVHQASIRPMAKGELRVTSPLLSAPHVLSVGQSSPLQSQNGSQYCPSPTVAAHTPTQVPITSHPQTYPQPVLVHSSHQEQSSGAEESSEESGGCTSEEDELAGVDTTPVRDTSCQTSMNKHAVQSSPEKTARKVMTVKYLLGELKTLVANQDSEAVRLISEVEQSISLLPAMVGSTNVQAELALALQPLRSENVQLRRRLRILNQQLMERERAERQARSVDCNLELATLQSLNITLQTQLNDNHRELGNLQQENQRLQQALEDKERDLQQTKEQCEIETSRIRLGKNWASQSVNQQYRPMMMPYSCPEPCRQKALLVPLNGPLAQDLETLDDNRGKDFLSHADGVGSQLKRSSEGTVNFAEQSQNARRCLKMGEASTCTGRPSVFESTVSSCDIKSLASDWSLNSWSTFNTRDEQDFRNGLAALDASIESLQRTLKADLKLK
uniref:Coiled-coil domain containing 14 n=1 Tax=Pygocentrus nattereri TaxID=42514 RepID=A0AAR2JLQ9_PYGNA